jgi:hypothetical protein
LLPPTVFALHVVLAECHSQHRIAPQLIVVIEILVAQCQPEYALHNQVQQGVLDQVRPAVVGEASGVTVHDAGPLFQLFQQQGSPIGGNIASIEVANQFPASQFLQRSQRLNDGVESSWSLQRRDHQSHADKDVWRCEM